MIVGVEHHSLAAPQIEDHFAHFGRGRRLARLDAEALGQFEVAHRHRIGRAAKGERHGQHDVSVGVLERACTKAESALLGRPVGHLAGLSVEHAKGGDRVGYLAAVGADVLHRRRAREAGNARHGGEPRPALLDGQRDEVVPGLAGGDGHLERIARPVNLNAMAADPYDHARPARVGCDQIAPTAEEQYRFAGCVGFADYRDEFVRRPRRDDSFRGAAEAKGGQIGKTSRHGARGYAARSSGPHRPVTAGDLCGGYVAVRACGRRG